MNAARNLIIDFRINGKHDHYIKKEVHPYQGDPLKKHRCTKKRRKF